MKKILFTILLCLCASMASAQHSDCDSLEIQAVIDACIAMRDAAASLDSAALCRSAQALKQTGTTEFHSLRLNDPNYYITRNSLRGHLVFNEDFAERLAVDSSYYEKADDLKNAMTHRGVTVDGSYFTKTGLVGAGKSTSYSFVSKGYQELAVVAEAGGLITMKIHVTNSAGLDQRYDDTKSVKKGMPQRKTSFTLPSDRRNTVELEIVNCGDKDCSFVVISN
ncbi:MAG: hypothetical protein K2H76_05780 [Muribaculaceae bacterium]|nr:hypothetical protein [Muribaculaceae bacterium]